MAGAGSKLFTAGSVLTADQVNTYLMDQTIMKFSSTSARDAAFGGAGEATLSEGMFAYTSDTDTLWFYTGSTWEVATIKPSIVDAKGDLLVGTAADTLARQAVGTNGQVLMADSGATNGVKWAGRTLLQIQGATKSTEFSNNTSNLVYTGLQVAITPLSTASTIYVSFHNTVNGTDGGGQILTRIVYGTESGNTVGTELMSMTVLPEPAVDARMPMHVAGQQSVALNSTSTHYFKVCTRHDDRDLTDTYYFNQYGRSLCSVWAMEVL